MYGGQGGGRSGGDSEGGRGGGGGGRRGEGAVARAKPKTRDFIFI